MLSREATLRTSSGCSSAECASAIAKYSRTFRLTISRWLFRGMLLSSGAERTDNGAVFNCRIIIDSARGSDPRERLLTMINPCLGQIFTAVKKLDGSPVDSFGPAFELDQQRLLSLITFGPKKVRATSYAGHLKFTGADRIIVQANTERSVMNGLDASVEIIFPVFSGERIVDFRGLPACLSIPDR